MKNEKKLETRDIEILIRMDKICNSICCADCIFCHENNGCLYSSVKGIIVEATKMPIGTLERMIKTAVEASEDTDD